MKDADNAIERVLAGLRAADAPAGLEQRVQDGVRRRIAQGGGAGGRSGAFGFGWLSVGFGCGCVAVLLAVALSVPRVGKRGGSAGSRGAEGLAVRQAAEREPASGDLGAGLSESARRSLKPRAGRAGSGNAKAGSSGKAGSFESLAGERKMRGKEEVEMASFPAPPIPLTEQERLLLRVADHGGPEEVAMLDSSRHAMQDATETTVFQDFFGKPERVEQTIQKTNQGENR